MKLDNLQPSGSFKSRGIGNLMTRAAATATGDVHFYCSSGGNAGLACATSAVALNKPATIVIPMTTSDLMKNKLLDLGVEVHQTGKNLAAADEYLRTELLSKDPQGVYVPPFDHPHVWDGASTIIPELRDQMDVPMDAIVCSVGGGGLFCGIMQGLDETGMSATRVVAVETIGADALTHSLAAGELVTLPAITSLATSLGARRVCEKAFDYARRETVSTAVLSDAEAIRACRRFADEEHILVELACGVCPAVCYNGMLQKLVPGLTKESVVVIVVCGGSNISFDIMEKYAASHLDGS